jgi:hypothetical protein
VARILCVDFDGVIHSYDSGWKGRSEIPDPPVPGAFEWLERLIEYNESGRSFAGGVPSPEPAFKIYIYSSRSAHRDGRHAMRQWFLAHGFDEDLLNKIVFAKEKPPAFLTIDDRAFCFKGTFPDSDWLLNFKPWNKS